MNEQDQYLVVLKLPGEVQEELNELRSALNPTGFKRAQAHLTLIPPFGITVSLQELEAFLSQYAKTKRSFYVFLQGIDNEFPKKEVAVIKVGPADPLEKIAKDLSHILRPGMASDGKIKTDTLLKRRFLPHITLCTRKVLTNNPSVETELTASMSNRPVSAEGISLWKLVEERWKPLATFEFSS